jgi:hypothetical protein
MRIPSASPSNGPGLRFFWPGMALFRAVEIFAQAVGQLDKIDGFMED